MIKIKQKLEKILVRVFNRFPFIRKFLFWVLNQIVRRF